MRANSITTKVGRDLRRSCVFFGRSRAESPSIVAKTSRALRESER